MTVYTDPRADADLDELADWLDGINPNTGDPFLAAARATFRRLTATPGLFARVSRAPRGREVRQGQVPGYNLVVTYEVTATQTVIWSVHHARQRSQPWRRRMTP